MIFTEDLMRSKKIIFIGDIYVTVALRGLKLLPHIEGAPLKLKKPEAVLIQTFVHPYRPINRPKNLMRQSL